MISTHQTGSPDLLSRLNRLKRSHNDVNSKLAALRTIESTLSAGSFSFNVKVVNRDTFAVAGELDINCPELNPFLPLIRALILQRVEILSALSLERHRDMQAVEDRMEAGRVF